MSLEQAKATVLRLGWTDRVRPMVIGAFFADLLAPSRRTIVQIDDGLSYFVDPLSQFGRTLVNDGRYELETEQMIREHLAAGRNVFAYFKHEETPEGAMYAVELLREFC